MPGSLTSIVLNGGKQRRGKTDPMYGIRAQSLKQRSIIGVEESRERRTESSGKTDAKIMKQ